jgi:hypothetical protein
MQDRLQRQAGTEQAAAEESEGSRAKGGGVERGERVAAGQEHAEHGLVTAPVLFQDQSRVRVCVCARARARVARTHTNLSHACACVERERVCMSRFFISLVLF